MKPCSACGVTLPGPGWTPETTETLEHPTAVATPPEEDCIRQVPHQLVVGGRVGNVSGLRLPHSIPMTPGGAEQAVEHLVRVSNELSAAHRALKNAPFRDDFEGFHSLAVRIVFAQDRHEAAMGALRRRAEKAEAAQPAPVDPPPSGLLHQLHQWIDNNSETPQKVGGVTLDVIDRLDQMLALRDDRSTGVSARCRQLTGELRRTKAALEAALKGADGRPVPEDSLESARSAALREIAQAATGSSREPLRSALAAAIWHLHRAAKNTAGQLRSDAARTYRHALEDALRECHDAAAPFLDAPAVES